MDTQEVKTNVSASVDPATHRIFPTDSVEAKSSIASGPVKSSADSVHVKTATVAPVNTRAMWWRDKEAVDQGISVKAKPRFSDIEYSLARGQWEHKAEFILSCVGLSVGLGNVWRFPYLAYENGGAAFLMAYLILQLLVGKPMYFMEVAMGQFAGKGPTRVWDMNPSAKGVGIAMVMISFITSIYYNVIMAYTLYFFFASLQSTPPWTHCKSEWIADYNCVSQRQKPPIVCTDDFNAMREAGSCTCSGDPAVDGDLSFRCTPKLTNHTTAAELFFYKTVIQRSVGVEFENMGTPIPVLTFYLGLSWTLVIFCLIEGIKSSGKVVYFTATFPYFVLLVLFLRGAMLDGAIDGVKFFLIPKWEKLADLGVWAAAAGQMFFSLSVGFGGIVMFGSYNNFRNKVYADAMLIASMDLITSVVGGLVVFTTFGAMAKTIGTTVDKVAKGGYGLAFIVYPEALSYMPPTQLWAVLFFFMLFTLGLDTEFALLETVLTTIQDEFPHLRMHRRKMCASLGFVCFITGLPCVCPGGDYVVTIMDHYGSESSLLILAFIEVVSVMWVYGVHHFVQDLEYMLGRRPRAWRYWAVCWCFCCPVIIAAMIVHRSKNYSPPKYPTGKPFPVFAQALGMCLTMTALCPVPIWFGYLVYSSFQDAGIETFEDRKKFLFSPNRHWIPNDGRTQSTNSMTSSDWQSPSDAGSGGRRF